jgi:hypothetical protein
MEAENWLGTNRRCKDSRTEGTTKPVSDPVENKLKIIIKEKNQHTW